jgi:Mg2+ and Co2+ transporter CorA
MPELHWHYGYFATAGMAIISAALFTLFKHINWL